MEISDFNAAGEILMNFWEEGILDKFSIVVEYFENSAKDSVEVDEKWVLRTAEFRSYLLQIIKCVDLPCCGDFQSTWKFIFP